MTWIKMFACAVAGSCLVAVGIGLAAAGPRCGTDASVACGGEVVPAAGKPLTRTETTTPAPRSKGATGAPKPKDATGTPTRGRSSDESTGPKGSSPRKATTVTADPGGK